MMTSRKSGYHFFLSHAGYSYDPKTETPIQGRRRCAKYLDYYEKRAHNYGCTFEWSIDPDCDSSEWSDEQPSWAQWQCLARDSSGKVFASLSGIDFGRDGEPWGNPYRRVVEAELACELPLQTDEE